MIAVPAPRRAAPVGASLLAIRSCSGTSAHTNHAEWVSDQRPSGGSRSLGAPNRREGAPPTGFGVHRLLWWEARPRGDAFSVAGRLEPARPLLVCRIAPAGGDRGGRAYA